jgi:hypothetical protein
MDEDTKTPTISSIKSYKKGLSKKTMLIFGLLIVVLASVAVYLFLHMDRGPIPKSVRKHANFSIYYPTVIPTDYTLEGSSPNVQSGSLFYSISNKDRRVYISEQKLPDNPPNLDSLTEFKKVDTIVGKAALGKNLGQATGILLSTTTLITVTGSNGVPDDVVARILQSMTSLPD